MTKDIEKKPAELPQAAHDRAYDFSAYSHARLGLGHTGGHLKSAHWLDFQAGFAQAKDAVFSSFDTESIVRLCDELHLPHLTVHSQTREILQFLTRPDLGRLIAVEDASKLHHAVSLHPDYCQQDLLMVVSGGLSPLAIQHQIPDFLPVLIKETKQHSWSLAPVIINPCGRVALGDLLNAIFKARVVIMLIGERPGLTTPDSLGIYVTYDARPGCTDEMRNCISNIHQHGLSVKLAVEKLCDLVDTILATKNSGISLKIQP
jgi:ethanolamine ammonia-lyase small subunit